jgi:hypothetical protein
LIGCVVSLVSVNASAPLSTANGVLVSDGICAIFRISAVVTPLLLPLLLELPLELLLPLLLELPLELLLLLLLELLLDTVAWWL